MKESFPHMLQAAHNLTNGSKEAKQVIENWKNSQGGSVEHLSFGEENQLTVVRAGKDPDENAHIAVAVHTVAHILPSNASEDVGS